jgi:hypothetical protein
MDEVFIWIRCRQHCKQHYLWQAVDQDGNVHNRHSQGNELSLPTNGPSPAGMSSVSYRLHRFPPLVVQHAVWLYLEGGSHSAAAQRYCRGISRKCSSSPPFPDLVNLTMPLGSIRPCGSRRFAGYPGLLHGGWPVPSRPQVAEATPEPKVPANRRREESRYERWASKIIHVKPLDRKRIAV